MRVCLSAFHIIRLNLRAELCCFREDRFQIEVLLICASLNVDKNVIWRMMLINTYVGGIVDSSSGDGKA